MACTSVVERFYPPYDNKAIDLFKLDGIAFDLDNATRFVAKFGDQTLDTDITPSGIETTANPGELSFDLSSLTLTVGQYGVTIIVYDPSHINGQVLIHDSDKKLIFDIKEV